MTESRPRGGKADPGSEIRPADQISGHDVRVSYGLRYMTISWRTEDRVNFRLRDAAVSAWITGWSVGGLVSLRLDVAAGYTRLSVDLPFYAKDKDRLYAFVRALRARFPGHAARASEGRWRGP